MKDLTTEQRDRLPATLRAIEARIRWRFQRGLRIMHLVTLRADLHRRDPESPYHGA